MQNKHATEQVDKTDAREWVQVLDDVFPLVRFSLVICCNEKVWDPVWCTVSFISLCRNEIWEKGNLAPSAIHMVIHADCPGDECGLPWGRVFHFTK